eukprot:598180_1
MASFVLYIAWMTSSLAIASNTETNSLSCYAPRVPTELSHIEGRLGLIGSPIAQFDASSFMITPITQNSNYNPHYLFTQTPQFLKPVENEVHVDTLLNSSAPLWKGIGQDSHGFNLSIAQSSSVSQLISTTVLFAHTCAVHNFEMIAFPCDYIGTSRSADDGGVHLSQPNTCMHESSNACKLMNCGLHHHRMDEAINAFNTTSSPP